MPVMLFLKDLKIIAEQTWENYIFQTLKGSLPCSQWWYLTSFKLIQVSMNVPVKCKNEEDQIKKMKPLV